MNFTALIDGLIGGLSSGLATCLGTLLFLLPTRAGQKVERFISFEFALGMMLAASIFSLLLPALQEPRVDLTLLAVVFGVVFILVLERILVRSPHLSANDSRASLFIAAMMLHNLPEGIAPGAALAGTSLHQSLPMIGAIALQNLPEGYTTALAFHALGASRRKAALGGFASGLVEISGGVIGGLLVGVVDGILPRLLGFAGGAMLIVTSRELWHRFREGTDHSALWWRLACGFFIVLILTL
ncbi:MAG: ZIP family metal transporter [Bdellovibrionaceae bacterium]|nr:ZIP family metal transporter [Pseudobdellovibrionaceae bacterium]MBX3034673.1 ZIP family metal transporter [Pseudobdellovibrionaceae bacterium]